MRYKGLFLEDPLAVPWPVVDYLAEQLGIGDPSQVKKYAVRAQTAYDHAWVIQDAYGYHTFDDRDSWTGRQLTRQFRTFLHGRAWTHAEGPVAWLRHGDGTGAAAGGQPGRLRAGPGGGVEGASAADEDPRQVRGGQQGAGAGPAG
ncbi:DUF4158 domain-containing protein [Nonomuraea jabiensis]